MLTEILVKMALVNGVKSLAGAMGWGGIEANAKGGVYSSASLSAYSGSVVDKPTFLHSLKGAVSWEKLALRLFYLYAVAPMEN